MTGVAITDAILFVAGDFRLRCPFVRETSGYEPWRVSRGLKQGHDPLDFRLASTS